MVDIACEILHNVPGNRACHSKFFGLDDYESRWQALREK